MKFYKDKDEAKEAGEDEDSLFTLQYRTDEEKRALELALMHGNRAQRRARRFSVSERTGKDGGPIPLLPSDRQRRNAARRVAKKQRRRNAS